MNHLVVSFISPDRPGIVDLLSNVVTNHQGNWQVSSMHHVSGFFAGIVEVAVPKDKAELLISSLKELPDFQINVAVAEVVTPSEAEVTLSLTANDRTGIVQEISSTIHHQGGNLLRVESSYAPAPHSGQALFKATAHVAVEASQLDDLIEALESLADDIMVDVQS